jgi:hypothetical protein
MAEAVVHVSQRCLGLIWPKVAGALDWTSSFQLPLPPAQLRNAVLAGTRDLWIALDHRYPSRLSSVIVTTILDRPRNERTLEIFLVSGRHFGTWSDSMACTLGRFAQAHGCTRLEIIGRWGWLRYLPPFDGYPAQAVIQTPLKRREGSLKKCRKPRPPLPERR